MIPIDTAKCSAVVVEIEMTGGRNIGKTGTSGVEIETVRLVAAEGMSSLDQPQERCRSRPFVGRRPQIQRRRPTLVRQNLPPIETSQVARVIGCEIAVSDQQVLPAVVVDICEDATPGPAPDLDIRFNADLGKLTVRRLRK